MWKDHFSKLYNCVPDGGAKANFYTTADSSSNNYTTCVTVRDIISAIDQQKKGKSPGPNELAMEYFIHGGLKLHVHLSLLVTLFLRHSYVPCAFMKSVILPHVKNKSGNTTDPDNYRAIAVSNAETKIVESVLLHKVSSISECDKYQFGFKKGHSTVMCTDVLKKTVDYYRSRGSHMFVCFVDFSKEFDRVNYWKLFKQLLDDGVEVNCVKLLAYWYSNQTVIVSWQNCTSAEFYISNGSRQGGVLSPYLFTRYVRPLLLTICNSQIGCNIGGLFINILAYADDMALLAPSWKAMNELINLLEKCCVELDIVCNTRKTVCMMFKPKCREKIVNCSFPCFTLYGQKIQFVTQFRYLGHILNVNNTDDDDIQREIRNLFIRTNMLLLRFSKCSPRVKCVLFRTYCLCFYDLALWKQYSATIFNKFTACYNKCIKKFFWLSQNGQYDWDIS